VPHADTEEPAALVFRSPTHERVHTAAAAVHHYRIDVAEPPENLTLEIHGPGRGIRLQHHGAHDFLSCPELAKTIVSPDMTAQERALAVFRFCARQTYRFSMAWGEYDMGRFINCYGYGFCWGQADLQHLLSEACGVPARAPSLKGHSSVELLLDGEWRVVDAFMRFLAPGPDLAGIATGAELAAHPELLEAACEPELATMLCDYWSRWAPGGTCEPHQDGHSMTYSLRRGESLALDYGRGDRWCVAPRQPHDICNGTWRYTPRFDDTGIADDAETVSNVKVIEQALSAADPSQPASITYRVHCPYPLVTGDALLTTTDLPQLTLAASADGGASWQLLAIDADGVAPMDSLLSVGKVAPGAAPATLAHEAVHELLVRLDWQGDGRLYMLDLSFVIQAHRPSLPALGPGVNQWTAIGSGSGDPSLSVVHRWREHPGLTLSETRPFAGDMVTIQAEVWNDTAEPATAPLIFRLADTGETIGETSVTAAPGTSAVASLDWHATLHEARDVAGAKMLYDRTVIEAVLPGTAADTAETTVGRATLRVRPLPRPRFSDALLWTSDQRDAAEQQLVVRAAICHPRSDTLYLEDTEIATTFTPYLGDPAHGGLQLAPAQRLTGIVCAEYAVAEWRIPTVALPATFTLWVVAVCDAPVAPECQRQSASRTVTL
jgi:hypothetical protein